MKNSLVPLTLILFFSISSGFIFYGNSLHRYATTCIENDAYGPIHYSRKWGDGEWKDFSIQPGDSHFHSWSYANLNNPTSPKLYIRFDCNRNKSGYQERMYELERFQTFEQDCNGAKKYKFIEFQKSSNGFLKGDSDGWLEIDMRSIN